jgi:hypothetical protein
MPAAIIPNYLHYTFRGLHSRIIFLCNLYKKKRAPFYREPAIAIKYTWNETNLLLYGRFYFSPPYNNTYSQTGQSPGQ